MRLVDTAPMHHSTQVLVFWCFVLFIFWQLYKLGTSGLCVQCGGKGRHREDCPLRKKP